METIQTTWQDLRISESILLQLHRDLLRYSNTDADSEWTSFQTGPPAAAHGR
jgi:hypothetical protein